MNCETAIRRVSFFAVLDYSAPREHKQQRLSSGNVHSKNSSVPPKGVCRCSILGQPDNIGADIIKARRQNPWIYRRPLRSSAVPLEPVRFYYVSSQYDLSGSSYTRS